eukprot:550608-Rhodomonas_salina.1
MTNLCCCAVTFFRSTLTTAPHLTRSSSLPAPVSRWTASVKAIFNWVSLRTAVATSSKKAFVQVKTRKSDGSEPNIASGSGESSNNSIRCPLAMSDAAGHAVNTCWAVVQVVPPGASRRLFAAVPITSGAGAGRSTAAVGSCIGPDCCCDASPALSLLAPCSLACAERKAAIDAARVKSEGTVRVTSLLSSHRRAMSSIEMPALISLWELGSVIATTLFAAAGTAARAKKRRGGGSIGRCGMEMSGEPVTERARRLPVVRVVSAVFKAGWGSRSGKFDILVAF